jgi:peptide/nickel transport system ATP-binding protein
VILDIKNLIVDFDTERGTARAVDGISFSLAKGQILGIVGESGSGKSVTSLSIMRLLPSPPARFSGGEVLFLPENAATPVGLLQLSEEAVRPYRGASIAMIFQEPMTSLNPVFRCGEQVTEAIILHQKVGKEEARNRALALFERVRLPDPQRIFDAYPHQISGGQKQRVMIAMALSCDPDILIADEPTTALDVTVQKAILELLLEIKAERGLSMLFISHDLGVISEICDRVVVMHKGKIVEEGPVAQVLHHPQHPYTKGLVACRPSLQHRLHRMPTVPDLLENPHFEAKVVGTAETRARREHLAAQPSILEVEDLVVRFPRRKNWLGQPVEWLDAVDKVGFQVFPGETYGIAGESGCGKTTLGRSIARLNAIHSGTIRYQGTVVSDLKESDFRPYRRDIQLVFQDPYSSLNPRMAIGEAIAEPMQVHGLQPNAAARRDKTVELLETVGLQPDHYHRYPHEFSGGQRQRICIARALALEPRLLICDEMVSALDVSVQATILNLLLDLREKFGLTYLFISHDLSVIKQMCDRLMIMNKGRVEALGYPDELFANPATDYVRQLIEAIPGRGS